MEINWFDIVAVMVNFFVLVYVLNRLFYGPVTKAMEDRKVRILKAEEAANKKMTQAEMLIDNYENKITNVEKEKTNILDNYRSEALLEKKELLKKYETEASFKRKQYLAEIEEEKNYFLKTLRKQLGNSAVEIASKILSTISSKELEEEIFKSFLNDLENLEKNIDNLDTSIKDADIVLYSADTVSEKRKESIQNALEKSIIYKGNITYKVKEDLIVGYLIELKNYTVSRSIKTYLDEVLNNIEQLLEKQELQG